MGCMIVVPDMVSRRARFMRTVGRDRRPGHLGREHDKQQDREPTAHETECSGYRVGRAGAGP